MSLKIVSTFPERLKEALGEGSTTELAMTIGMSKQSISAYANGSRNPKRPTIKALSEALNVNEMWLMGYDVSPNRQFNTGDVLDNSSSTSELDNNRLRNRRLELKLTLEDVGDVVGIGRAGVQKYEKGIIKNVNISTVMQFAKALDCSPSYLLGWSDNKYDRESPTNLDESSRLLLSNYEQLNDEGKEKLISYSNDLVDTGRYLKENQSGLDKKKMA